MGFLSVASLVLLGVWSTGCGEGDTVPLAESTSTSHTDIDTGCMELDWYADADADGYGDPWDVVRSCERPDGYVANADDCDDGDADLWHCMGLTAAATVGAYLEGASLFLGGGRDVTGDGSPDIVLGSWSAVYVVDGSPVPGTTSSLDSAATAMLSTGNAMYVGMAEDLNNSGTSELIVSNFAAPRGAFVFEGPVSGVIEFADADIQVTTGPGTSAALDTADLDGDGARDLVITDSSHATQYACKDGIAYVVPGPLGTGTVDAQTESRTVITGDCMGIDDGLDAGDVNGDGVADLVVGMPQAYGTYYDGLYGSGDGGAAVFYGPLPVGQLNGYADSDVELNSTDRAGFGVDVVPDADGDGIDDVLLGGAEWAGYYTPHTARPGLDPAASWVGETSFASFGSGAGLGDVDGDGFGDLAIGAASPSDEGGRVYIFYGPPSGSRALASTADEALVGDPGDGIGLGLWAGDTDGDGRRDLLIGGYYSKMVWVPGWALAAL